jgi:sugar phosphate isomerase/epimerase
MKLSVQLYTLRDQTAVDFPAVAAALATIGLRAVELAGHGNLKSAAEVRRALDAHGLVVSGAHVGLDAMTDNAAVAKVLDEQETLGNRNVIVPWVGEAYRSADGYRRLADELTRIGAACAARGCSVAYHNHDFEFADFNGTRGLDILWQHTDPALVKAEVDVYWVAHAGVDPAKYVAEVGRRVTLLHLKDLTTTPTGEKRFAPVGSGRLDFKAIAAAAGALGSVEWGAIEQDDCYGEDPLAVVRKSYEYLRTIGLK